MWSSIHSYSFFDNPQDPEHLVFLLGYVCCTRKRKNAGILVYMHITLGAHVQRGLGIFIICLIQTPVQVGRQA